MGQLHRELPYFYGVNLTEQLLAEHSRKNADRIARYVLSDRRRHAALLEAVLQRTNVTLAQRAAMVIGDVGRHRPTWLLPGLRKLLAAAEEPQHPAVQRMVMRFLSELDPGDVCPDLKGRVVSLALDLTGDPNCPVAIRVFAMQTAANFAVIYPELCGELRALLETHLPHGKPGFVSRATKILRVLP